jgi:hypothetical protein
MYEFVYINLYMKNNFYIYKLNNLGVIRVWAGTKNLALILFW